MTRHYWRTASLLLLVVASALFFGGCDEFFPSQSKVTSVRISPINLFMKAGQTQQFTATAVTLAGDESDVTSTAGWSSSNTAIVDVDRKGLATAQTRSSLGTATVTASASGQTASTSVSVASGTLNSITINATSTTVTVGNTLQLTATGGFDDGSSANVTNLVSWSSSDTSKATINSTGLVSAVAAGTVTITARANVAGGTSVSQTKDITVSQF